MKLLEITNKSDQELAELIRTVRTDLAKAVIESRTKEMKNTKTLAKHKRTIARAMTIAREREIAKLEQVK